MGIKLKSTSVLNDSAGLPEMKRMSSKPGSHLKVHINTIKSLGVLRQLVTDVFRSNKDAFQVRPRPLHLKPDRYHRVWCRQLLLPQRHFLQEVPDVLGRDEVLKLHLTKKDNSIPSARLFLRSEDKLLQSYMMSFLACSESLKVNNRYRTGQIRLERLSQLT